MRRLATLAALALAATPIVGASAGPLAVGDTAPAFTLVGTDDKKHSLADYLGKGEAATPATVVVFTCNACPFSQIYEPVLIDMQKKYAEQGVKFVLVNPNDPKVQPGDSFELMKTRAKEKGYPFDYLYDATQETAKAYGATNTPHVYLLDSKGVLRYRGRVNDNKEQDKVQANDLANAIDAVVAGKDVAVSDTKAFGCSIKWKKTS